MMHEKGHPHPYAQKTGLVQTSRACAIFYQRLPGHLRSGGALVCRVPVHIVPVDKVAILADVRPCSFERNTEDNMNSRFACHCLRKTNACARLIAWPCDHVRNDHIFYDNSRTML